MQKMPISKKGMDGVVAELKQLKTIDRPEVLEQVQWARSLGDLSENAEYSAAKEKQRNIDKRIGFLENLVEHSYVVDIDSLSGDKVMFGAKVEAEDQDGNKLVCKILSDIESDGRMVISCTSPVGRAFIGKCVGEFCTVRLPGGEKEYEILNVSFKE